MTLQYSIGKLNLRWHLSMFIWFLSLVTLDAHDSKVAYFDVQLVNENVVVQAEFPWTIRNALLIYEPQTSDSLDQGYWEATFRKYIEASLLLIDENGNPLNLINVEQFNADGHHHQVNYVFTFQGSQFVEIINTIMFNVSDKQTNHHNISMGDINIVASTTKAKPTINLHENEGNMFFLLIIPFIILSYLFIKRKRKRFD